MKKILSAILALTMLLSSAVLCVTAEQSTTPTGAWSSYATTDWYTSDSDSNTTVDEKDDNTFTINSATDLAGLAVLVEEQQVTFVNKTVQVNSALEEINLGGHYWLPIGRDGRAFCGLFDGNNVPIKNMIIDNSAFNNNNAGEQGLFGLIRYDSASDTYKAGVKNLSLSGSLASTAAKNGFVVGCIYTGAATKIILENISVEETISITAAANQGYGGILGYAQISNANAELLIKNVTVNVSLTANSQPRYIGGVIAQVHTNKGTINIENAIIKGTVNCYADVAGGLIGWGNGANKHSYTNCLILASVYSEKSAEASLLGYIGKDASTHTISNVVVVGATNTEIIGKNTTAAKINASDNYYVDVAENGTNYTAVRAEQLNAFSNILTVAKGLTSYANMENVLGSLLNACANISKDRGLCAIQLSNDTTQPYSVRFICKLDSTDGLAKAGVTIKIGDTEQTKDVYTVYNGICGTSEYGITQSYSADLLGAEYLYAVGVSGIPADVENVKITVTPFAVTLDEETEYEQAYTVTLSNGKFVSSEKVTG